MSQQSEYSSARNSMDYYLTFHPAMASASSLTSSLSSSTSNTGDNITNQTQCPLDSNQPQQMYVELSTFWYSFLALITSVGLLVSLVSNMIIIYLFTSTASLRRNPSNIIAANLSLSDLLYCIQWPSVIYCSLTQSTWILEYDFVCQSFGFITLSTALASILTVLAMSVERAVIIMYSMKARKRFTNRWAWFIIVLIWIMSLSSALPPLFGGFNRYTLDPSKTSCTLDYLTRQSNYKLYILILYGAYWIAPAIVITISYILIIITFKRSSLSLKSLEADYDRESGRITRFSQASQSTTTRPSVSDSIKFYQEHMPPRDQRTRPTETRRLSFTSKELASSRLLEARNSEPLDRDSGGSMLYKSVPSDGHPRPKTKYKDASQRGGRVNHECQRTSSKTSSKTRFVRKIKLTSSASISLYSKPSTSQCYSSQANSNQITRTALQYRLAKMSFYLIVLWLVSWTPIASLAMINAVRRCHKASATAVFISSTMTKLGPTFDVFIYGISHPKTKSKFKHLIKWPFRSNRATSRPTRSSFVHSVAMEANNTIKLTH